MSAAAIGIVSSPSCEVSALFTLCGLTSRHTQSIHVDRMLVTLLVHIAMTSRRCATVYDHIYKCAYTTVPWRSYRPGNADNVLMNDLSLETLG